MTFNGEEPVVLVKVNCVLVFIYPFPKVDSRLVALQEIKGFILYIDS